MGENDGPDFSEICIVGGDLTEVNVRRFGPEIRRLDLSFNVITKLKGLEVCAETLEELVLDNNQLESLEISTIFPKLNTVSLNKNQIHDLHKLLLDLKAKAPFLHYLSILGNPICPDQLSDDFASDSDYQIYRYHVLYHLPTIKFLDHRPVSAQELSESRKPLYGNIQIYPLVTPLPETGPGITIMKTRVAGSVARSRQGKKKVKYVGKNSEGNRFIRDNDL